MKINKVILSVNNNKLYLDFWKPVSMIWKLKFNIEPVLYYFYSNFLEEDIEIDETYGKVIRIPLIKGIPDAIQIMWARYFMPSLDPENTYIISDIDMLPMSKEYFLQQIENVPEDSYVHINPCIESYGLIPSCYHISKGKNFKKYLELPELWQESILQVINSGHGKEINNNKFWFADEQYATEKLLKNKDDKVLLLNRKNGQNGFRIDRDSWFYDEKQILKNFYYDCHSIRPYEKYKEEIDKIIHLIMSAE